MNEWDPIDDEKANPPMADQTPNLRDQFAMAALQGDLTGRTGSYLLFELAESAYHMADAMLEARKK